MTLCLMHIGLVPLVASALHAFSTAQVASSLPALMHNHSGGNSVRFIGPLSPTSRLHHTL